MVCSETTYGQRLLPNLIEDRSHERPDDIYALVPKSTDFKDGMVEITYGALATTIDRLACWLEQTFGKSKSFETLAYMGSGKTSCRSSLHMGTYYCLL